MAIAGFPGMCRVHRADVIGLRGGWREAELEARNAFDELRNFNAAYAAEAQYVIGETRLWRGGFFGGGEGLRPGPGGWRGSETGPGGPRVAGGEGGAGGGTPPPPPGAQR